MLCDLDIMVFVRRLQLWDRLKSGNSAHHCAFCYHLLSDVTFLFKYIYLLLIHLCLLLLLPPLLPSLLFAYKRIPSLDTILSEVRLSIFGSLRITRVARLFALILWVRNHHGSRTKSVTEYLTDCIQYWFSYRLFQIVITVLISLPDTLTSEYRIAIFTEHLYNWIPIITRKLSVPPSGFGDLEE